MSFSSYSEAEHQVFERIAQQLEAQGYDFVDSSEVSVPTGSWGYIPDYIAQRGNEFIAIEIKARRTRATEKSLSTLKSVIEESENWKFLVYYADELSESNLVKTIDEEYLRNTINDILSIKESGFHQAAFLLAWGTLEAAARFTHKRIFLKPQTPGRIITVLAERGVFTPNQANRLRALALKRNHLIHGGLNEIVQPTDIDFVMSAVSDILLSRD